MKTRLPSHRVPTLQLVGGLIAFAASIVILQPARSDAQSLTDGLLAYYHCNGNALDSSGNELSGTLGSTASPTTDRYGNPNAALLCGTGGWAVSGTGLNLANSSLTVAFWVSKQYVGDGSNGGWILQVGNNGAQGQALNIAMDYGQSIRFSFYYDDFDIDSPVLAEGEWYHLAFSYDATSNQRTIYVNGDPVATDVAQFGFSGSSAFFFGNQDIDMSDVRFYNRVLSPAEVMALYQAKHHQLVIQATLRSIATSGTIVNLVSTPVNNKSVIAAIVSGTTGLKAKDLDIAMNDLTGEIDVIRRSPAAPLYILGYSNVFTTTDAELQSTNSRRPGGCIVLSQYLFSLPFAGMPGPVDTSMFLKLGTVKNDPEPFASNISQFFGGFDAGQSDSYILQGVASTRKTEYTY